MNTEQLRSPVYNNREASDGDGAASSPCQRQVSAIAL